MMKKIILMNLLILGGVLFSSAQTKPNEQFKGHFTLLYENYINLKAAFIKSDVNSVREMAKEVQRQLPNVAKLSVKLTDNKVWNAHAEKITNSLKAIIEVEDIEKQRANFAILSDALYHNIKAYGVVGMKTYYQYCPMAADGKGAYWLSIQENIRNPYFGDKMMTCGKTKEIIE